MANKQNGEVTLTVAGNQYTLRMTHRAAAIAEDAMGRSIFSVEGGGVRYVAALLYSMIEGQHGVRTVDDALGLLDDGDALEITRAVNEATSLFFLSNYQANGKATAPR